MLSEPFDRGVAMGMRMGMGMGMGMAIGPSKNALALPNPHSHPHSPLPHPHSPLEYGHGSAHGPIGSGRMGASTHNPRWAVAVGPPGTSAMAMGMGMARNDLVGFEGEDDDDSRNTEHTSTESNQEVYAYPEYNYGSSFAHAPYDLGMSDGGYADLVASDKSWGVSHIAPPPDTFEIGCSKFYVSNLPVDIRLEELEDLFVKFGPLSDVLIKSQRKNPKTIADRPYAIISYRRPADAQIAMQQMHGYIHRNVTLNIALHRPAHSRSTNTERLVGSSSATKMLYGPLKRASSYDGFGTHRPPAIELHGRFHDTSPPFQYIDSPTTSELPMHSNELVGSDSLFSDQNSSSYQIQQQQWNVPNRQPFLPVEQLDSESYHPFTVQQPLNIHAGHWLPQVHRTGYECLNHGSEVSPVALELDPLGPPVSNQDACQSRLSPSSVSDVNTDDGVFADGDSRRGRKANLMYESASMVSSSLFAYDAQATFEPRSPEENVVTVVENAGRSTRRPPVHTLNRYRTGKAADSSGTLSSNTEQSNCKFNLVIDPLSLSENLSSLEVNSSGSKPSPALQNEDLLVALMLGASAGALAAISAVHGLGYRRAS